MDKQDFKILIVEDEEALADVLSAKLAKEGFSILNAYDGEEGYAKIIETKPDLILLDIVMPKMDGYDVLEKMQDNGIKIPVIIISNSGQPVEIEKTKKLGAINHLIKTQFDPADVVSMVNDFVRTKFGGGAVEEKIELTKNVNKDVPSNGIKVLLVEDDSFLREISSKKLSKEGFIVYEAMDGEQAVYGAENVEPDIILLDIILPILDGFQILEKIKSNSDPKISEVPVIMLSHLGQDDDIKKAMEMGAKDYLVKAHFTTEEIVGKIKSILEK